MRRTAVGTGIYSPPPNVSPCLPDLPLARPLRGWGPGGLSAGSPELPREKGHNHSLRSSAVCCEPGTRRSTDPVMSGEGPMAVRSGLLFMFCPRTSRGAMHQRTFPTLPLAPM
jgi:hypothetical protein